MQLLGTLSLLLILVVVQLTLAEVDFERPNLSKFKLKPIKNKQEQFPERRKTSESIVDLASGAKYLHQSLFAKDKIVRCSSYAHLFKIIKQKQNSHSRDPLTERIKQDFVESLAIDVAAEKDFYESLFNKELRTSVPENFIEATKSLEILGINNGEHIKGAWLDLLSCMSNYMEKHGKIRDPAIIEFLWRNEERKEALSELEKSEANDSNVPTTNGMVAYITKQISGDTKNGRSVCGRFLSNQAINESNEILSSFDDEATQKARAEYQRKFKFNKSATSSESSDKSGDFLENHLNGIKEPMPDYDYNNNNESIPGSLDFDSSPSSLKSDFDESKMDVLDSVKAQLNNLHKNGGSPSNSPQIDMSSAIDFLAYFEDLDSAKLDPTSELGKRAILFQQSPQNRQILARVKAVVGTYVELKSVLAELKMQEDLWKSVDSDLKPQLDRLENLLKSFDPAFNAEEIRREVEKWRAKCSEYAAIHQFIETDPE